MSKWTERWTGKHLLKRVIIMLLAVAVMGIGVGLFVRAAMGSDPYSTMNLGISSKLGVTFGIWQAFINVVLLLLVVIFDRGKLGLGTVGNMFVIGFTADLVGEVFKVALPPEVQLGIPARVMLTLLGVALMIVGCSFYVTTDLGMAPYDAISYIVPARTKIPFRWWRIGTDVVCVAIGFTCGAAVGVGTLIMAFGTGPLLPLCNRYVAAPVVGINIEKDT